jgi:8-oxo-dGTP diphosphatase
MPKTKPFRYDYARPAITVDVIIATRSASPRVLLIQRKGEPFAGCWALPGGFVEEGETLAAAARRETLEETGLVLDDLEQLYTAGDPGRDPRGWTVSVAYLARVPDDAPKAAAGDDAAAVKWFALKKLPKLAFDHAMILDRAAAKLRLRAE